MGSFAHEIAGGTAAYLAGLGLVAWDDFGEGTAYTADSEWPTFLGPDMPPTPDSVVVITPTSQTKIRGDVLQGLQIRLRGPATSADEAHPDPRIVADKAQAIEDALYPNGFPLVHVTLGAVRVGAVLFGNATPFSPDGRGRHGHVMNFTVRARRPRPQ